MSRRVDVVSVVGTGIVAIAAAPLVVAGAGLVLGRPDVYVVGVRVAGTLVGLLCAFCIVGVGSVWLTNKLSPDEGTADCTVDQIPLPAELRPMADELASLGFVRAGQTRTIPAPKRATRFYENYLKPSDPRVVAELAVTEKRVSFTSYLPDGRVIETGCPPILPAAAHRASGWKVVPDWGVVIETADGVTVALALHEAALDLEAATGSAAIPIPGYRSVIEWDNVIVGRVRSFREHQAWEKLRGLWWAVPLGLFTFWTGVFAPWQ